MLSAFFGTNPRTTITGSEQFALEVASPLVRHNRGQRRALTREPLDRLERPDRTLNTRRADLEEVLPRDGLVHIETIRQSSAETCAIPHLDAPRSIEKHPDRAPAPLDQELDIHELESILRRQRICQLPNLFSDLQIGLPG